MSNNELSSFRRRVLELEPLIFAKDLHFTQQLLHEMPAVEVTAMIAEQIDHTVYEFRLRIMAHAHTPQRVTYPRDWWEALKLRFAPMWFTRHYPVYYHSVVFSAKTLFPDLRLPSNMRTLHILERQEDNDWIAEDYHAR